MTDRFKKFSRKYVNIVGGAALRGLEALVAKASLVSNEPILDNSEFEWAKELEDNWTDIREELEGVLNSSERIPNFQEISTDQVAITTDDKWKTYFLYGMGIPSETHCRRCPRTAELIAKIPGMQTAFFSILYPGKHIPAHRGLFKGFVRYHLGLIVPEPRTSVKIRVADQYANWEEGKSLIFDDTYDHEVWNDTDGIRVVLFLDVIRPTRFPVSAMITGIIAIVRRSRYVQDAIDNFYKWEDEAARHEAETSEVA